MRMLVSQNTINNAVCLLEKGEIIAFPTETVYGLGADVTNPNAIQKIFDLKKRPVNRPLSLLIPHFQTISDWAINIPEYLENLSKNFWPGPLTVILYQKIRHLEKPLWENERIGFRISSNFVVRQLLKGLGRPLAAPSANISGQLSLTKAIHVQEQFKNQITLILERDNCAIGMESTVLDATQNPPCILRAGAISRKAIEAVLGIKVETQSSDTQFANNKAIKLFWVSKKELEEKLKENMLCLKGVLAFSEKTHTVSNNHVWIKMPRNVEQYRYRFYDHIYQLYEQGCHTVWVERFPQHAEWAALAESLNRWCFPLQKSVF